jgi:hypothetical protein
MIQELVKIAKKVYSMTPDELDKRIEEIRVETAMLEEFNRSSFDLNIEAYMIVHRIIDSNKRSI